MKLSSIEEIVEEQLRSDPLREYHTWWDELSEADLTALDQAIGNAKREEDIQQFLQRNPKYLIQHLCGGHGRWVIPKQKLGAEHVTDFVIGVKHSFGYEWQVVELEAPSKKMFNKNGDASQSLNHAIRQIQDWRAWLSRNQNYACRPKNEGGLSLTDITQNTPGLILIGRREDIDPSTNDRRRQMVHDLNISIRSYDFLIDNLSGRLMSLGLKTHNQANHGDR